MQLQGNSINIDIPQLYVQTADKPNIELAWSYVDLLSLEFTKRHEITIIMVDPNAKVGSTSGKEEERVEKIIGGYRQRGERKRLQQFC